MERVNYVCAKYGLLLDVVGPKLQVRPILHPSYTKFTPILHQQRHVSSENDDDRSGSENDDDDNAMEAIEVAVDLVMDAEAEAEE